MIVDRVEDVAEEGRLRWRSNNQREDGWDDAEEVTRSGQRSVSREGGGIGVVSAAEPQTRAGGTIDG